jgi:hypothetical protein
MFSLDEDQMIKANNWRGAHDCPITNEGAIGGKTTYCFTPTGIGTVTVVKCACGKEINLTDYESW